MFVFLMVSLTISYWNYEELNRNPHAWDDFAECRGNQQSPIDVTRELRTYDKCTIENVLDSPYGRFKLYTSAGVAYYDQIGEILFKIKCGNDEEGVYPFVRIMLRDSAEHLLRGRKHSSELQIIFMGNAGDEKSYLKGRAMRLGFSTIFFRKRNNPRLNALMDSLAHAQNYSMIHEINLEKLFGNIKVMYTYQGSFPVPPCTEGVTWRLGYDYMSNKQNKAIRSIRKPSEKGIDNARPVQKRAQAHRLMNDLII